MITYTAEEISRVFRALEGRKFEVELSERKVTISFPEPKAVSLSENELMATWLGEELSSK